MSRISGLLCFVLPGTSFITGVCGPNVDRAVDILRVTHTDSKLLGFYFSNRNILMKLGNLYK